MVKMCAAVNCRQKDGKKSRENGISFHKFPQEKALRKRWLVRVRRIDAKSKRLWQPRCSYLCSDHFEPECFHKVKKMKKLKRDAEPTLFPLNDVTNKVSVKRRTLTSIVADAPAQKAPLTLQQLNKNIREEHDYSTTTANLVEEINDLKNKLKTTKRELDATRKRLKRREKSLTSVTAELVEISEIHQRRTEEEID